MQSHLMAEILHLDNIVRNEKFQFRGLHHGTVKKYASSYRAEVELPPLKVARLKGAYILVDGWHRAAALESIGERRVVVEVVPATSEAEVQWLAAQANVAHGLPLKAGEYRKVFRAYVQARKHRKYDKSFKSYREIAAELGGARGHTTIRNWMEKDFPSVFRAMRGRDEGLNTKSPEATSSPTLAETAFKALQEAQAAMPAIDDPALQWEFLNILNEMLQSTEGLGWTPQEPDF